ncbi:MAG TPA: four helix bundle protein [Anaerolineales bacterium]|nr:four helix bundle protein [Anaerolineales bacterium]
MSKLPYAESFRDLLVYQKARNLALEIFQITKTFPREEMFSLTDQIRRSSRSIGAQIAEAWAKRRYEKHFISKLTDADGERQETLHWIDQAVDCGYLSPNQAAELNEKYDEIGRLLAGMIAKSHLFCGPPSRKVSESIPDYFVKSYLDEKELSLPTEN